MEDAIQKNRMDCVYFLASPLTCKKGSECEYRHSENARINPRDCWYWLNGSCLNPNCAFRHPPLEGLTEPVSNSVHFPSNSAVSTSKSDVPCYFYFNAYCIKGDQCPFLHEISPAQKFSKEAPEPAQKSSKEAPEPAIRPPEHRSSTGSHTGPPSVELPENPSEGTPELIKQYRSKEAQQPAHGSVVEESSPSTESSVPECEEPAIKLPNSLLPLVEYREGSSGHLCPDQSSEELVKERIEPDEYWESSPGFDVLVDDGSDHLAYRDDAEYLAQENESEILHGHLLHYGFEGSDGYDPIDHPGAGYLYDHSRYDPYDHLERNTPEYFQRDSEHSRERLLEPMIHRKRKLSCREREVNARGGDVDLRDHLRKQRRMDVRQVTHNSRKYRSCRTRGNSNERPMRRGKGPFLHRRLASEVGKKMIGSSYSETESVSRQRRGWSGNPPSNRNVRTKHRERKERRMRRTKSPPAISSEFSRGSASKEANSTRVMIAGFTGPKTLAQIQEEKSRTKANINGTASHMRRRLRRPMSEDFEGPKPLNELLKDKRNAYISGSTNGLDSMTSKQEPLRSICSQAVNRVEDSVPKYHGTAEKHDREYENNYFDDDDDDDDDDCLRKKLAHILSR